MNNKLIYCLMFCLTAFFLPLYAEALDNSTTDDIPKYVTTKPEFTEGLFPCSSCHASMEPNRQRRELGFHTEIQLNHAQKQRWCLDCHDSSNRDMLKLANGDLVSFETSYNLCGQCHGNVFRDWKTGIHGKRVGYWNGDKTYYLCVNCHSPHSPRFKAVKPMPEPAKPQDVNKVQSTSLVEVGGTKLSIPQYKGRIK
ncbi:MAG: hypothetical protein H7844_01345 [Nitrospirae bacterium YQR-1]